MAYYDRIKTPRIFLENALTRQAVSFATLQQSENWECAASRWGIQHLFACRVICKQPSDILPLLADRVYPGCEDGLHECINNLIQGPRDSAATLKRMAEIQIVHAYERESLGYVWAALAPLLKSERVDFHTSTSERRVRERRQPERQDYVSSAGFQISSSPPDMADTASSAPSSIEYTEGPSAPLVEDYTVRFLSCLIRCVLNYSQPLTKSKPFIQYHDERLAYAFGTNTEKGFKAIDDGGVQIEQEENSQVALVEAKRSFQDIRDGSPTVSDELLAQIVGEALAARVSKTERVSENNIVSIVAVKYYIKFFHFSITEEFVHQFRTLAPTDENPDMATYMQLDSTGWFDMRGKAGRKYFVRHLLGLIGWANDAVIKGNIQDLENLEDFMDTE
ncbi:hypothetical protein AJ79_08138 [Helicocarpus griseus UAMH5409]|uniref:Uncharacterized protein n=1 Tax=Helicocarpus griseus UAMH5409 TaxID=1447875 RepID=A0A2B7WW92_9EURO|nr:hypothetical protein AJ79_08138 [Helicocarpus griseus UAMH5409]